MFNYRDNSKVIWHKHAEQPYVGQLRASLLQIVDWCLAGVIFIVPFVMGGRHPLGQLILVALAVVAAAAWAIRQSLSPHPTWRPTWAMALISAGAMIIILQTIPLPESLLERLTPRHDNILPLWNPEISASASLGRWSIISFSPEDTRAGLVLFLTYGLLFFVTIQRIKAIEDVERLLRWCAISVICMATFGLAQYLAGNGKFFWCLTNPFTNTFDGAKGSFTNRNHFAHFIALGVGPLIWWLLHVSRRMRPGMHDTLHSSISGARSGELKTYLLGLALAVVLFAGLMSLSRGGMAALLLAAAVSSAVCYWASSGVGRFLGILLAACVLIGAALSVFGLDSVSRRLETVTSAGIERNDWSGGRIGVWTSTAKAIPDYICLGAGAGSFREVYPMYTDNILDNNLLDDKIEFTHAESSYLQVLLETGAIGFGLALAGIALWGFWCVAGWRGAARLKVCAGAIAGSLAAGTSQSLVDFVWYVPACMAIMAILAACALRVSQFSAVDSHSVHAAPMRRFAAVAAAIVLMPVGAWMIHNRIGPAIAQPYWDQYLTAMRVENAELSPPDSADSTARRAAIDAVLVKERKLIDCLEKTIFWQPTHAWAHLALAEAHLRLFDELQTDSVNPMPLVNIRDAALESEFSSKEELHAWLERACGKHWVHLDEALRHARQAILLCPLQGRGYVYLAKLCFLEGKMGLSKQAYLTQALQVRPFDGAVVCAAAAEALLAGDTRQWLELSKQVFRCSRIYRRQLIANLIANTQSEAIQETIEFIVAQFQPDLEGLQFLYDVCSKRVASERLLPLCLYQALRAEFEAGTRNNREAAIVWLKAHNFYTRLNNGPKALQCARRALECDQNNFLVHYQLASRLLEQKNFAEAESHLHWCLQRTSGNKSVEYKLKEALKGRLDAERSAAAQRGDKF